MTRNNVDHQALQPIEWVKEGSLDSLCPPLSLLPLLLEKGLLTARIQQRCKRSFQLEVLGAGEAGSHWLDHYQNWAPCSGKRREIVMWCDGRPGMYAETVIPDATANAQPWIRSLGTQPLGERLQLMEGVTRSAFEYARIDASEIVPSSWLGESLAPAVLWARRSAFYIQQDPLWVIEVFLSAVTTPAQEA